MVLVLVRFHFKFSPDFWELCRESDHVENVRLCVIIDVYRICCVVVFVGGGIAAWASRNYIIVMAPVAQNVRSDCGTKVPSFVLHVCVQQTTGSAAAAAATTIWILR